MPVGLVGVVISPAGYLLYFPLDRNALLGEAMQSVDGIAKLVVFPAQHKVS